MSLVQKKLNNPVTVAIGDGNNDVNMIHQASCGFGLQGNEGNSASQAADFAIVKFRDVRRLIFTHGRVWAYNNSFFIYFV